MSKKSAKRKKALSGWVGLILLLFQLTVIVPVIAAFAWRGKNETQPKEFREDCANL